MEIPQILMNVTPVYGHLMPCRAVAQLLIQRGYPVTILTGTAWKPAIEAAGIAFRPLEGLANYSEVDFPKYLPEMMTKTTTESQLAYYWANLFVETIPSQFESIQMALTDLKADNPAKKIVLISESLAWGAIPLLLNAPGLRPDAIVSLSPIALYLSSTIVPPFGLGLPPDFSDDGRKKNADLNRHMQNDTCGYVQEKFLQVLSDLGAETTDIFFLDAAIVLPQRYLQMSIPSLEYPRPEATSSIRYIGPLPHGSRDPAVALPNFWRELESSGKKIIAVTQGTLAVDYANLIAPTLEGLKDSPEITIVAVLGKRGGILPPEIKVPENARVADFIPYDDLFPLCEVVVTNGGFGGLLHALSHGVPLLLAGTTEDKSENSARAEWAGAAVNLKTNSPTPEQVRWGVQQVLGDPKLKARAVQLQEEMHKFSLVDLMIENLEELLS